jgi:hypothetical protein
VSIETKQVNVTPEQAGKWLDRHWDRIEKGKFRQRPMSMTRVLRYAQTMRDGQWKLTPEGLAFDEEDNLIQGQHRLEAVRRSGVTVPFMVSTGWPSATLDVLDQGATRSNAQLLALKNGFGGYSSRYAGAVGAIIRVAYRGHSSAVTFANCEYMLEKLGLKGNIDAIMVKSPNYLKDFQSSVVAPLAYYHTVRPKKALDFAEGLFNFESVKGSPLNLYMNWIKSGRWQAREPGSTMHTFQRKLAGLSACLRAWDENTTITRVVSSANTIEWLGDMNPKLRDWVREHITRNPSSRKTDPPKAPEKK